MLRIHAFPPSPRSFKVLLAANHLGIDYEFQLVDLSKGQSRTPEFAALNPNQKAPVLEDNGFLLWESNAILQYLASKNPAAGLLPADERARADVTRWMFWEATTWDPACATLVFQRVVKPLLGLGAADQAEVEKGLASFMSAAAILDAHLKGRRFVCGDFSLADLTLGAMLVVAEQAQLPLQSHAAIQRWAGEITALPAWSKTVAMLAPRAAA